MRECEDSKTRLELGIGYKIYRAYMTLHLDGHVKIFTLVGASADIGLTSFPTLYRCKCARWCLKMLIHKWCGGVVQGVSECDSGCRGFGDGARIVLCCAEGAMGEPS